MAQVELVFGNVGKREWNLLLCTTLYQTLSRILGVPSQQVVARADGTSVIGVNTVGNPKRVFVLVYWPEGANYSLAGEVVAAIGEFLRGHQFGSFDVSFVETTAHSRDGRFLSEEEE